MMNVYFLHWTTDYEKPYNVRNFKMVHFYHELPCVLWNFTNPPNPTTILIVSSLKKIKGKKVDH
jgi:hypothetical protein